MYTRVSSLGGTSRLRLVQPSSSRVSSRLSAVNTPNAQPRRSFIQVSSLVDHASAGLNFSFQPSAFSLQPSALNLQRSSTVFQWPQRQPQSNAMLRIARSGQCHSFTTSPRGSSTLGPLPGRCGVPEAAFQIVTYEKQTYEKQTATATGGSVSRAGRTRPMGSPSCPPPSISQPFRACHHLGAGQSAPASAAARSVPIST